MNDAAHEAIRSYRPGTWYAIFGDHASVLLPASEKARVAALWELVDAGAGFDELLDALIATGLRALPGFVLISTQEDPTRIVLRGSARAEVTLADGDLREVDGGAAATWVEQTLSSVTGLRLILEDEDEAVDFGIRGGLVRASRIDQPPYAASPPGPVADQHVADAPVTASILADPLTDELSPEVVAQADSGWVETPAHDVEAQQIETETHAFPFFNDPEDAEKPSDEVETPEGSGDQSAGPTPVPQWGQPVQGNVYVPPAAPENPFGPGSQNPVDPPMWVPPAPESGGFPAQEPDPGRDSGPDSDHASDHDGQTVAGGNSPDQFVRQHPGIPGQTPAPNVTAQPVARLVFSSGETVDVDRAVLVGRAPEARRFTSTDQPRLVTVSSPNQEISSTHLEVRPGSGVDHGSAIVTDMGSTNGTVLSQPGFAPEDLQPGIAVQLLPGAVIDLGDGVTIAVTSI